MTVIRNAGLQISNDRFGFIGWLARNKYHTTRGLVASKHILPKRSYVGGYLSTVFQALMRPKRTQQPIVPITPGMEGKEAQNERPTDDYF